MRKWLPLVAICLGTFMLLVDVTIVNVALPSMAMDLRTVFSSLQWVVDAYALALAALLMGVGAIADLSGHKKLYLLGLVLFAVASIVCGFAPHAGILVAARGLQGVGAAAMFATTFALINGSYRGRDRGTAYGVWGAISGAAAALGPVLGGVLTEGISWRWIFFVNVPVSIVAILLSRRVLPRDPRSTRERIDIAGLLVFTITIGSVTFAMIRAGESGWGSSSVLLLLGIGAIGLIAFILIERRALHPLIDLALFRQPTFVGVLLAGIVLYFSAYGYLPYTSIWMQTLLGLTPVQAGLASLPLPVASFAASLIVGRSIAHARAGSMIGIGLVLIGAGALLSALLVTRGSSWPALLPGLLIAGIGVGLATPTLSATGAAAVGPARSGMAAGAVNTAGQLGFAFGIAILGSTFSAHAATALDVAGLPFPHDKAMLLAGGQAQTLIAQANHSEGFTDLAHTAFASGLDGTLLVAGIAAVIAGLAVLRLIRAPREEALHSRSHA